MRKHVYIYFNTKREPICSFYTDGGEVTKHQICSHLLMAWDSFENLNKIRIKIVDEEVQ